MRMRAREVNQFDMKFIISKLSTIILKVLCKVDKWEERKNSRKKAHDKCTCFVKTNFIGLSIFIFVRLFPLIPHKKNIHINILKRNLPYSSNFRLFFFLSFVNIVLSICMVCDGMFFVLFFVLGFYRYWTHFKAWNNFATQRIITGW